MKKTATQKLKAIKTERDRIEDCKTMIACAEEDALKIKQYLEKTRGSDAPDMTARSAMRVSQYNYALKSLQRALDYHIRRTEIAFSRIEDKRYTILLRMRYLQDEKWADIARELHYSQARIMQLHQEALHAYSVADKGLHKVITDYSNVEP